MKKSKFLKLTLIITTFVLILTACSSQGNSPAEADTNNEIVNETDDIVTVEIEDAHGRVKVPVNPKNVVSLDSRSFETLEAWGIELAAAPKAVMSPASTYVEDESVLDIGNHREPNLEIIAAVDPDLVIIGQRFATFYDDIKALVPNAVVIDLDIDVSESAATPGENLVKGLKDSTVSLGKIFDKNEEAEKLVADFDKAIEDAKAAYNGRDKIMSVIVSGGNIGFSAPHNGRVWGPMYEIFGWTPALEVGSTTSDHQGDEISVEAIAQSNPDWILVLDRDAATTTAADSVPAQDVIDNSPALQNVKAVVEGKIVYAPNDTYTNESIQTYLELFGNLGKTLAK